jgi:hypothetical protein
MKKTIFYLALLVALAATTYFVLKNSKPKPFGNADFSITDTAQVGKIFLVDMQGNSIKATRAASGWKLNDSLSLSTSRLASVFDFLTNVKPTQVVPEGMLNTVAKGLATNGIKVEVYNLQNEKMRSMIVGGTIDGQVGNYIKVEGVEKAHFYKIPGYESDLFPNVSTELEPWLNKYIYTYAADSIAQVSVFYSIDPDSSFVIQNSGDKKKISARYTSGSCTEQKGKSFFKQFEKIPCVGYINNTIGADSIFTKGLPFGNIVTQLKNGTIDTVQLVYYKADQRSKTPKLYKGVPVDMEYFYGRRKNNKFILTTSTLAKILSTPSFMMQ